MQLSDGQGRLVPDVQQPQETAELPEGRQEELNAERKLFCSVCRKNNHKL